MNQTAKIRIEGSNYPVVRFFMWVGPASFAMMFTALWLSEFALAAVGFTLLLIARVAGDYFHRKGSGKVKTVFDARRVASPWIYSKL